MLRMHVGWICCIIRICQLGSMRLQSGDKVLKLALQLLLLLRGVSVFLTVAGKEELWSQVQPQQLVSFNPLLSLQEMLQLICSSTQAAVSDSTEDRIASYLDAAFHLQHTGCGGCQHGRSNCIVPKNCCELEDQTLVTGSCTLSSALFVEQNEFQQAVMYLDKSRHSLQFHPSAGLHALTSPIDT